MTHVNFRTVLEGQLHADARIKAFREGITLTALVNKAIEQYVYSPGQDEETAPGKSFSSGEVRKPYRPSWT